MNLQQKVFLISALIMLPISIYSGNMMAWLFGNFFPGFTWHDGTPSTLWRLGMIAATQVVGTLLLFGIISLFLPRK
jgi:hypothetical protein